MKNETHCDSVWLTVVHKVRIRNAHNACDYASTQTHAVIYYNNKSNNNY